MSKRTVIISLIFGVSFPFPCWLCHITCSLSSNNHCALFSARGFCGNYLLSCLFLIIRYFPNMKTLTLLLLSIECLKLGYYNFIFKLGYLNLMKIKRSIFNTKLTLKFSFHRNDLFLKGIIIILSSRKNI